MAKKKGKKSEITAVLPPPGDLTVIAQKIDPQNVNKKALRRGKVRELMRMGYDISQIVLILDNGIKTGDGSIIKVPVTYHIIKNDIDYVLSEDASIDIDFATKRAAIIGKLDFLYNQAVREYLDAKGAIKNSFLNTALSVLEKLTKIEGVESPENLNIKLSDEARVARFAEEIHKLDDKDKSLIISTIRKVLERRKPAGTGGPGVSSKTPAVRTQTSDNKGVPRKS